MISRTLSQIAVHQPLIPWMACLGLVIFATFFGVMLAWTARRKNQQLYQAMSLLPLGDEVNS